MYCWFRIYFWWADTTSKMVDEISRHLLLRGLDFGWSLEHISDFSNASLKSIRQVSLHLNQGRIQDLKLGVAQMDWNLKSGCGVCGGGIVWIYFKSTYHGMYISTKIYFKCDFYCINIYLKPPLYNNIVSKNLIWKFFQGGRAPGAPPSKSVLVNRGKCYFDHIGKRWTTNPSTPPQVCSWLTEITQEIWSRNIDVKWTPWLTPSVCLY